MPFKKKKELQYGELNYSEKDAHVQRTRQQLIPEQSFFEFTQSYWTERPMVQHSGPK